MMAPTTENPMISFGSVFKFPNHTWMDHVFADLLCLAMTFLLFTPRNSRCRSLRLSLAGSWLLAELHPLVRLIGHAFYGGQQPGHFHHAAHSILYFH